MNKKTYSFDIFDTCLVRTCGEPCNVFYLLADIILGTDADVSQKHDFVLIRKKGEEKARQTLLNEQKEEVTIYDIYQFCNFTGVTEIDNDIIMQNELEIESQVLLPVYEVKKEIQLLHDKGHTIYYISDMYLPKVFIIEILKRYDFYINDSNVYISSEVNKTKYSGSLFDYVQKRNNINIKYWVHTGDNKHSDFIVPKRKGIKCVLINHDYNIYENMAINNWSEEWESNNNYAFSLCRALRLSCSNTPQNKFAANFIAPIFVPYTYYILCDANKRGIKHLYFMARDGYILYLIAQILSSNFPHIKLHYLYASRKSLYLPGIEQISYNVIKDIIPLDKGIQGILYALQIEDFDYSHLFIKGLSSLGILKLLFEDKQFIDKITTKHLEQKELCYKYLIQEGLSSPNCAIVDVLGSRRCHKYINNILKHYHLPEVFAYYYEVTHQRILDSGNYSAVNFQEADIHFRLYHHVSQPLCEQYFCITNQQRTIGYREENNKIMPVFETDPIESNYKESIFNSNRMILQTYATHFIKHPITNPILCIKKAQFCLNMFYYNPVKDYLDAFNGFFCTDGNSKYILLKKKNLLFIIQHLNHFFRWKEGNLIYNSGLLYKLIRIILSIRLYKRMFN